MVHDCGQSFPHQIGFRALARRGHGLEARELRFGKFDRDRRHWPGYYQIHKKQYLLVGGRSAIC